MGSSGSEKRAYRNKRYNSTDSPAPLLRLSSVTGRNADILEVQDPDLGYDAETFLYQDLRGDEVALLCPVVGEVMWKSFHIIKS
jgi:hypothetical protein